MDQPTGQKTVLIVEDDEALMKALKSKFQSEGLGVLTAVNGDEGLKIALSQHPNIITLDLLMPVKNGVAFMDEIRQDEWGKNVPIIILTNYDSNDFLISKVEKDKPSYYLIKTNVELQSVVDKVKEVLKI